MTDRQRRDARPWAGWEVEGWPTTVLRRGYVMVEKGPLLGAPTDGAHIPRTINPSGATAPGL